MSRLALGLAAAAPLAFYDGLAASFTLPKLACACAALIAGSVGVLRRKPRLARTALDLPLILCLAALLASALRSQDRYLSFAGMYNYYTYGVVPLILCASFYWLAVWSADEEATNSFLSVALWTAAVAGSYSVVQSFGLDPFPVTGGLFGGRPTAVSGSPIALGAYLALALPLALRAALEERGAADWMRCAATLAGLAATRSRGGWAGAAAGAVAYLLMSGRRRPAAVLTTVLLICGAGIAVAHQRIPLKDANRVEIWKIAGRIFLEHPWLGAGPDTVELGFRRLKTEAYIKTATTYQELQAHAHNDILQALATTGLVGCAAYFFLLARLLAAARRALADPGRRSLAAAEASALLSLFVVMKANPAPFESLVLAAIGAGLICRGEPRREGRALPGACAFLLAAIAVAGSAFTLDLWAADRQMTVAEACLRAGDGDHALEHFTRGIDLNPGELTYRIRFINFLSSAAAATPSPAIRLALSDRAAATAVEAVAWHPNISSSHYALGAASLLQARAGESEALAVAERELDAALALDPNLGSLLQIRLEAAQLRGDAAKIAELQRRQAALKAL